MLNRNVGHLMTNPAILDSKGLEVGEGLIDAMCITLIAMHDLSKSSGIRNSLLGLFILLNQKCMDQKKLLLQKKYFRM